MSVAEAIHEFDERHGVNDCVIYGDSIYFADGARRDNKQWMPRLDEPPHDEHLRAKAVLKFWQLKNNAKTSEFTTTKEALLNSGHHTDEQIEHLKELRRVGRECQRELEKAEQRVRDTDPNYIARRQRFDDAWSLYQAIEEKLEEAEDTKEHKRLEKKLRKQRETLHVAAVNLQRRGGEIPEEAKEAVNEERWIKHQQAKKEYEEQQRKREELNKINL